jgi:hypothetical protein
MHSGRSNFSANICNPDEVSNSIYLLAHQVGNIDDSDGFATWDFRSGDGHCSNVAGAAVKVQRTAA